jgi:hypothetical protein
VPSVGDNSSKYRLLIIQRFGQVWLLRNVMRDMPRPFAADNAVESAMLRRSIWETSGRFVR